MNTINHNRLIQITALLCLVLFGSIAFAQDDDVLGFDRQFPIAWKGSFEAPISQGEFFTVYNLFLISAKNSKSTPVFHRLSLGGKIEENPPELMEYKGLPSAFQLEAFEVNPFTQHLIVAGKNQNSQSVIYTAPITPKAELSDFQLLEVEADYSQASFQRVLFSGPWVFFLFSEPIERGDQQDIGGAVKLVTQKEELAWLPIPAPSKVRQNASFLMGTNGIYQVGGTYSDEKNPDKGQRVAIHSEMIGFDPPNFSAWKYVSLTGFKDLKNSSGISYGAGMFVAPVVEPVQEEPSEDPDPAKVYYALDKADSNPTMFYRIIMDFPQTEFKNMVVDPSHSWLLVMSQGDKPGSVDTLAMKLPKVFTAKPVSEKTIRLKQMDKSAAKPPRVNLTETLSKAKDKNKYAFIVVGSGEYEEDILVRSEMTSTRFRYTIQNTQMTYLEGDDANEAVDKFEIKDFPAYLLVDPDGNVITSHSGSIPSAPTLMEMTRKTRVGFGPNAENQTESNDN